MRNAYQTGKYHVVMRTEIMSVTVAQFARTDEGYAEMTLLIEGLRKNAPEGVTFIIEA